jgi:hypothetical protein
MDSADRRLHADDDLPEDHDALLRLAIGVSMDAASPFAATPLIPAATLPGPRAVHITDEASALVGDPSVGFSTHGR